MNRKLFFGCWNKAEWMNENCASKKCLQHQRRPWFPFLIMGIFFEKIMIWNILWITIRDRKLKLNTCDWKRTVHHGKNVTDQHFMKNRIECLQIWKLANCFGRNELFLSQKLKKPAANAPSSCSSLTILGFIKVKVN